MPVPGACLTPPSVIWPGANARAYTLNDDAPQSVACQLSLVSCQPISHDGIEVARLSSATYTVTLRFTLNWRCVAAVTALSSLAVRIRIPPARFGASAVIV